MHIFTFLPALFNEEEAAFIVAVVDCFLQICIHKNVMSTISRNRCPVIRLTICLISQIGLYVKQLAISTLHFLAGPFMLVDHAWGSRECHTT